MIYYYAIILIALFFCLFLKDENKKQKKIVIAIMVILLSLLSGLRHYTIGNDTGNYLRHFEQITIYGADAIKMSSFEIGYNVFEYLVSFFSSNYNVFLFIVSLVINTSVGVFIYKYSRKAMFSFVLFILLRFFFGEMNIIREYLAIAVFLTSMKYIENRKLIKFSIVTIIASLFHTSSLFAFAIYFLYDMKLTPLKKYVLLVFCAGVCAFLYPLAIQMTSLLGVYGKYIPRFYDSDELGNIIMTIISVVIYVFYHVVRRKYADGVMKEDVIERKRLDFYENILFTIILLNTIAIRISIFDRVVLYFQMFYIIAIPNIIKMISNPKRRLLWYIIVLVCFFAYFVTIIYLRPNWNNVNPYRFFWE